VEFVYSAHVDAAATLGVAAALLLALQRWRGARLLAGVALGMAALIKLYPLLFVMALLRRRDPGFVAGLFLTLMVVCLPFVHLGLGGGGFLTTYFSQRFVDQGIIFRLITLVFIDRGWQFGLQAAVLTLLTGMVLYLRLQRRLRGAGGILALSAAWIVVSPHLFPWYVGGLLPFLALYLRLPYPAGPQASRPASSPDLAGGAPVPAVALWLFVMAMPFTYVILAPGYSANLFFLFFAVPAALAGISLAQGIRHDRGVPGPRGRYAALTGASTQATLRGGEHPPPPAHFL
jgi:hypothetical protein